MILSKNTKSIFLSFFGLFFFTITLAQAPTSLQYPGTTVITTDIDNVFLSPTVSGNVTSYSITPALPAGLSFNTNTGIITGTSTTNFSATNFVIKATNVSGNTSFTLSLSSVRQYYNNAGAAVVFTAANQTPKLYSGTLADAGRAAGDIILYTNVTTIGGVNIDCIVTTAVVNNVTGWDAYDQPLASGPNFSSNDDKFFSPQVTYGNGGGSMKFDFQFILGGSYNNVSNMGTNITLQNVYANTYDIDGNGTAIQYNEFGGFATSELGTSTNLLVSYTNTTGLTRYTSNTATNTLSVTDPKNRVRVNYKEMSDYSIVVGANATGLAYFFLDFSIGSVAFTTNSTPAPSIDLNSITTGVNNLANACSADANFTIPGQTNAATALNADVNEFTIAFPTGNIINGNNEKLLVTGATAGGSIDLNFANGATISNIVLGAITYKVSATVANGVSTLTLVRNTGTIPLASLEALLDALVYKNTATSASNGKRSFTVNTRNTFYRSPDAIFAVTLNCVGISGNIYHDANALTDNIINSNSVPAAPFSNNSLYAVLVNPVTNKVIASKGITGNAYDFGNVDPANYVIYFSPTNPAAGATVTASTLPAGGYVSIGENLGAAAGNDLLVDGKLTLTVGSVNVINANFGLQIPPTATGVNVASSLNPGGYNLKSIPGANFGTADADGTVESITITSFPTNINALKVGTTVYINGGTCPPQSNCISWPGTLTIAYSGGNPASTIEVDPVDGASTVVFNYTAKDNGNAVSTASSISVPFTIPATALQISGYVWNDGNGNAILDGAETKINVAKIGETLYAVLVQKTNTYSGANTIYASTPVSATSGYIFPNVPTGNDYLVRIVSKASAPVDGAIETSVTAALASSYFAVSTSIGGTGVTGLNTDNPVNTLNGFTATKTEVNFGLDRTPTATSANYTISTPVYNSVKQLTSANSLGALAGNDAEDGVKGATSKVKFINIDGLNGNVLKYNGTTVTAGTVITSYDPTLLTITFLGSGSLNASFTFVFVDNAGLAGTDPGTYTIDWATVLPVKLISFEAKANGNIVNVSWKTTNEINVASYTVQYSVDGINWKTGTAKAANASMSYKEVDTKPMTGVNYYRLMIKDLDGTVTYSEVRKVIFNGSKVMITAWPNPTTEVLNIKAESGSVKSVLMINAGGQIVFKSATSLEKIAVQNLAKGIYILQVTLNDGTVEKLKIVKE